MDNSSLDLGKIVSLIMENPKLVSDIKAMAENKEKTEEEDIKDEENEVKEEPKMASADILPNQKKETFSGDHTHSNRKRLLAAFKPYLSEERKRALDSIVSITDIIDAMKAR